MFAYLLTDLRYYVQLKWFDDPVVQCMQSIDVTDIKDVTLKRDFFSILPQAIPQFPRVMTAHLPADELIMMMINVKKLNSLKQCLTATRPTSHN